VTPDATATALTQARALRAALEGLHAAVAAGDAGAVLAAEAPLATAVAACAAAPVATGDRDAAAAELRHARALLARCRVAGAALTAVLDATLAVLGGGAAYDRQGGRRSGAVRRHDLQARG
jgi:hypothetical protein